MRGDFFDETMGLLKAGGASLNVETNEQVWSKEVYRIFDLHTDFRPTIENTIRYFHPACKTILLDAVQRSISRGDSFDGELQFVSPKGNKRWVRETWEARRVNGRTQRIICAVQDISRHKWMARDSRRMGCKLEERLNHGSSRPDSIFPEIAGINQRLEAERICAPQSAPGADALGRIIGRSEALKDVLGQVAKVAPSDTTVLITGETGTGKELIANAVHSLSMRGKKPMITVNCAALPPNLMESELFGFEKGAFTGAVARQIGRFEIADGSTICLDEIGEMPLEMQAKLLRVIQHREFERLGSCRPLKVDTRIVAITNRNLAQEVRKGRFRQDLYYRLNVFPIAVPPLRMRREDIPVLVEAFTRKFAGKLGKKITSVPGKIVRTLQDYPWPGNIRELQSVIERAAILCPGPALELADKLDTLSYTLPPVTGTLREVERDQILKALCRTQWRIEGKHGAAAILDINPSTLRARMRKLGVRRPVKGKARKPVSPKI